MGLVIIRVTAQDSNSMGRDMMKIMTAQDGSSICTNMTVQDDNSMWTIKDMAA